MDPSGNASCGEGLEGGDCENILDRSDEARDSFREVQSRVDALVDRIDDDGNLHIRTRDRKFVERLRSHFGEGVLSVENLSQISRRLGEMADRIGPRGEGVVIRKVDRYQGAGDKGLIAQAHPQRNLITLTRLFSERTKIYMDKRYGEGFADRYISRVIGNEIGHPAFTFGPGMPGGTGDITYGWEQVEELGAGKRPGDPYSNIDSYACLALECH